MRYREKHVRPEEFVRSWTEKERRHVVLNLRVSNEMRGWLRTMNIERLEKNQLKLTSTLYPETRVQ
jgi:hypothetical protein